MRTASGFAGSRAASARRHADGVVVLAGPQRLLRRCRAAGRRRFLRARHRRGERRREATHEQGQCARASRFAHSQRPKGARRSPRSSISRSSSFLSYSAAGITPLASRSVSSCASRRACVARSSATRGSDAAAALRPAEGWRKNLFASVPSGPRADRDRRGRRHRRRHRAWRVRSAADSYVSYSRCTSRRA